MKRSSVRRLFLESLETRKLLASDLCQNFVFPEDVDGDKVVSSLDVLVVVNALNSNRTPLDGEGNMIDVDGDSNATALDALVVVNHLNGRSELSTIDAESRMSRISQAIESGSLPNQVSIDDAYNLLATLRSGGRPERGDRVVLGHLIQTESSDSEGVELEIERIEIEQNIPDAGRILNRLVALGTSGEVVASLRQMINSSPEDTPVTREKIRETLEKHGVDCDRVIPKTEPFPDEASPDVRLKSLLESLEYRLQQAGVSTEIIETIGNEFLASLENRTPMTIDDLRARLTELGVDPQKIFPRPTVEPIEPSRPNSKPDFPDLIRGVVARLKGAGVTPEVVETIVKEFRASITSGAPLTLEQIRSRLTELGVDVSKVFPGDPVNPSPAETKVRGWIERLRWAGVTPEVIETIVKEIKASIESENPLTTLQIMARLTELGVDVSKLLAPGRPRR